MSCLVSLFSLDVSKDRFFFVRSGSPLYETHSCLSVCLSVCLFSTPIYFFYLLRSYHRYSTIDVLLIAQLTQI